MSFIKQGITFVFSIYGFLVFLLLMFVLFPAFLVAFMLPRPKDGNAVHQIAYGWASVLFFLTGIRYQPIYKGKPEKGRSYVFITNHISYLDIPMMLLATHGFPVRILGKAEMANIPVFGYIYRVGAVTVQRDSTEKRGESVRKLKKFLGKKISILIAPEGTFNMTNKPLKSFYKGAFGIAAELSQPIQPVIFPDTYDRMNYRSFFSLTPGRCRAVFLPAIPPSGSGEQAVKSLKEQAFAQMEQEIIRLKVSWIQADNTARK